jgi:hypothetical protein
VGCNHGGPATALHSRIASIDKFLGPPNLQVAGAPVEGRSGGGLFTNDGLVIGVCNAADPADNEGLYAALASIHQELDEAGLTAIYGARPAPGNVAGNPHMPVMPTSMPEPSMPAGGSQAALPSNAAGVNDGAEVICVVRPLNNPNAASEVIRLDRASQAFLTQLASDRQAQAARHLTSLEVPSRRQFAPAANSTPKLPAGGVRWSGSDQPPTKSVLR